MEFNIGNKIRIIKATVTLKSITRREYENVGKVDIIKNVNNEFIELEKYGTLSVNCLEKVDNDAIDITLPIDESTEYHPIWEFVCYTPLKIE